MLAVFKHALGSPQDDDDDEEPPEVSAARRSAAAAVHMPSAYNDPVYVEACVQKMLSVLPASCHKLRVQPWFYREVRDLCIPLF